MTRALSFTAAVLLAGLGMVLPAHGASYAPLTIHDVDLLDSGNLLVTDGGASGNGLGGGVYEIDREGEIVWSFTAGLAWAHNADLAPDGTIIVSDTGNDRVLIVALDGSVVWNSALVPLSDGSTLVYPNDANLLPGGNRLITDRDNQRVIEIDAAGSVVWQFGVTGVPGGDPAHLSGPHNADRLASGNTLIADSNNHRVLEVSPAGAVVWFFAGGLDWPRDADRLASGNTLILDSRHDRLLEVTPAKLIAWSASTPPLPYDADRLAGGTTLLSADGQILELDPAGDSVWSWPTVLSTEIVEGYLVTAPNGNELWVRLIQPRVDLYPGQRFPAVVSVPGGLGGGETGNLRLAGDGFVEVHFNAEGRGIQHPSEGVEDCNGFAQQDDLKAVIEYALGLANVDPGNLGVVTSSYGITMGAGCLGRYPGLTVKYLLDLEGPSESYVTCFEPWSLDADATNDRIESALAIFGHYSTTRDPSPANVAWWSEREATRYIGSVRCAYLRAQAEWDHAQPPNAAYPIFDYPPLWYPGKHGIDLVNLATAGAACWTRMNGAALGNPPGATYSREDPPAFYSGTTQAHPGLTRELILELAGMPLPTAVEPAAGAVSAILMLAPNQPNPFNPATWIGFTLPWDGRARVSIHDPRGRLIRLLADGWYPAGSHAVTWDGRLEGGGPAPSGTYLVRLRGPTAAAGRAASSARKITLLR